jgi:hypothetical protein
LDHWRRFFGECWVGEVVEREHEWRSALGGVRTRLKYHPLWKRRGRPPVGRVRFGSLQRLKAINLDCGLVCEQLIDGHHIDKRLAHHGGNVRARVQKIAHESCTQKVGGCNTVGTVLNNMPQFGKSNSSVMCFLYAVRAAPQQPASVETSTNLSKRATRRIAQ